MIFREKRTEGEGERNKNKKIRFHQCRERTFLLFSSFPFICACVCECFVTDS